MEVVLLVARLVLALVFGVAGIAKAADRAGSRSAFSGFGVPEPLAARLADALPFVEILVAVALVPLVSAWWAAVAALTVLMTFTVGIGFSLARGETPDCRCFGQLHSEPVSWATFARNLVLSSLAGLVVVTGRNNPGLSVFSWLADLKTAELAYVILGVILVGLLAAAIILLNRLLKRQAALLRGVEAIRGALDEDGEPARVERREALLPAEGLPVGANAPKFALTTITGDEVSLDDLLGHDRAVLLIFAGPHCWGCKILLPMVRAWQRDYADYLDIAVLSSGTLRENQDKMFKYEIKHILLDEGSAIADTYQARWTPAAVLIHSDGRIASQSVYGDDAIRELVRDLMSSGQVQPRSADGNGKYGHVPQVATRYSVRRIGEPVPSFALPDLSGTKFSTKDLLGSSTLLIFWHPLCEFCKAMTNDIRDWELAPPDDAPRLVFIAAGKVQETRAVNKDFKSSTLLDPGFEMAPLFGTKYTPSAILIDEEGRIASSLAMGDHNVRALIGLPKAKLLATAHN